MRRSRREDNTCYNEFYVDPQPIVLCEPAWRRGTTDELELYAVMETGRLRSTRAQTIRKLAPRPDSVTLYVGSFDPAGVEGQSVRLEMRAIKDYAGKGGPRTPALKPGTRQRRIGRLRQKISRKLGQTYLFGTISSKTVTHVLRELAATAGGTLEHVAVIIRRTPRPKEIQPEWTVFLAVP
jgi:hypothetical protein